MKKSRKPSRAYQVKSKVRLNTKPIKAWRALRQYSQKQAAEHCGLSLPAYQNAEYGNFVQLKTAALVAKGINRELQELEFENV